MREKRLKSSALSWPGQSSTPKQAESRLESVANEVKKSGQTQTLSLNNTYNDYSDQKRLASANLTAFLKPIVDGLHSAKSPVASKNGSTSARKRISSRKTQSVGRNLSDQQRLLLQTATSSVNTSPTAADGAAAEEMPDTAGSEAQQVSAATITAILKYLQEEGSDSLATPFQLKESHIHSLVDMGRAGESTLMYLKLICKEDKQYRSVNELASAISNKHVDMLVHRKQVLTYLMYPQQSGCKLLSGTGSLTLSSVDASRLFDETDAGLDTLMYLKELDWKGRTFHDVSGLVHTVKQMHETRTDYMFKVLQYLNSPSCKVLKGSEEAIEVTPTEVDALFASGVPPTASFQYMQELEELGQSFESMRELGEAIKQVYETRQQVYVFLTDANVCSIFDPAMRKAKSGTISLAKDINVGSQGIKVAFDDINRLFSKAGININIMYHVKLLQEEGFKATSFEDLIIAVQDAVDAQKIVLDFLRDNEHQHLLGPSAEVSRDHIAKILSFAKSNATFKLKQLEWANMSTIRSRGYAYSSADKLALAVEKLISVEAPYKEAVVEFLQKHKNTLLADDVRMDVSDAEQMFIDAGAGRDTLRHLQSLQQSKKRLSSWSDLANYVQQEHIKLLKDKHGLFNYLEDTRQHSLFEAALEPVVVVIARYPIL